MRHLTSSAFTVTTDLDVAIVAAGRVLSELTKHPIDAITITPPSLEELFLRHYGDPGASKERL